MSEEKKDLDSLLSKDKKTIKKRRVLGRPKKEDNDKATNRVSCYLNDSDFEQLQKNAEDEINLSYYLKKLILKDVKK